MKYCHNHFPVVIHRDLKSHNILLDAVEKENKSNSKRKYRVKKKKKIFNKYN